MQLKARWLGNRISQENKERSMHAFEAHDQDYLVIPDNLGIYRSTARGIITWYLRESGVDERLCGGQNQVDEVLRRCLEAISNKNCPLTLAAINAVVMTYPRKTSCHHHWLHHIEVCGRHAVNVEASTSSQVERNRQYVVKRRHDYAHWFLDEANFHNTIFVDKCL